MSVPKLLSYWFRKLSKHKKLQQSLDAWSGLLFDVFIKKFCVEGMCFEIPENTTRVFRGRFTFGSHEWNERAMAKRHIRADDQVLELGGGMGVVSCCINRSLDQPDKHVVFEPDEKLVPLLTRNRDNNACQFVIEQAVLGDPDDYAGKQLKRGGLGVKFIDAEDEAATGQSGSAESGDTASRVMSLEACEKRHQCQFTVLFMDIEGCEYELAERHQEELQRFRMIILERHTKHLSTEQNNFINLTLEQIGFQCIDKVWEVETWERTA